MNGIPLMVAFAAAGAWAFVLGVLTAVGDDRRRPYADEVERL